MLFSHVPAWGFGSGRSREPVKTDSAYTPGPGSYKFSYRARKGPSWGMGSSSRGTLGLKSDSPGPGAYSIKPYSRGPKFSMRFKPNSSLELRNRSRSPGPIYLPKIRSGSPKFSIQGKYHFKKNLMSDTPGPEYNINTKNMRRAPAYSFTHAKTEGDAPKNIGPGPGAYKLDKENDKPKYGFGTATRDAAGSKDEGPGPGQYSIKSTVTDGPKITMAQRSDYDPTTKEQLDNPGPGNYEVRKGPAGPLYSIGTSNRAALYKEGEGPGPAGYTVDSGTIATRNKNPAWKIGTGNRGDLADGDKDVPGVGRYNIGKKPKGPFISITGKGNMNDIKDNGVPASNAYLPNNSDLRKAPAYSFTHAEPPDDSKKGKYSPGPGAYNLEKDNDKPKYGFGTADRDTGSNGNNVPGPGQYPINSTVGEGPKITIAQRLDYDPTTREQLDNPGPGNYEVRKGPAGPLYSIGTSQRPGFKASNTPGPADYKPDNLNVIRNKNPEWVIGTGNRGDLADGDKDIPGVGTYQVAKNPKGPFYSITGKGNMNDIKDNGVPGSNAYLPNNSDLRKAPAYSFTHAPIGEKIDPTKQGPGPGAYKLDKDNDKPKYSFGKENRDGPVSKYDGPGPGEYPYKTTVGEGPKITMAHKYDSDPSKGEQSKMPGPGTYDVRGGPAGPLYSIGTSQRQGFKGTDTPGPADYKPDNLNMVRNKNPEWKIGTGNRGDLADGDRDIPGVGSYQLTPAPKGPFISITGKGNMNDIKDNGVPGSNAYLPNNSDLRKAPAYSFTHAPIGEKIDPTKLPPGPGQYNLEKDNDKPKYSFGRDERSVSTVDDGPGPGQYPYKTTVGEGPKITMAHKYDSDPISKQQKDMPGPGNYDVRGGPAGPIYSIGTSQRPGFKGSDTPGPADYKTDNLNLIRNKNPEWKIGTGNRGDLADGDKDVPGVGTYQLPQKPKGPFISITGKGNMNDIKDNGVPGSNAYLPNNSDLRKAPAYSFTHAPIGDDIDPTKLPPGPGAYKLDKDNDKPKYSFGKEMRVKPTVTDPNPGPGQYPIKSTVGEGAKITIAEKHPYDPEEKEREGMPGPGTYTLKDGDKGPKYSVGTSQRPGFKGTDTPGPADYKPEKDLDTVKPKGPEWKIGTGNRPDLATGDKDVPGAGKYYKPEKPKGPFISITGKGNMNDIKDNGVPGSNAYLPNNSDLRKAPAYSFTKATEPKDDPSKNGPGPGAYNLEKDNDKPKYGFGTSTRDGKTEETSPGPGNYPIKSTVGEGPKITIAEKHPYDPEEKEREGMPGPGTYTLKDGDKGPKYSVGTSQRPGFKGTDTPGPADYKVDDGTKATKPKGPEWKIGTGNRGDLATGDKDVPGAGEYYKPENPKGPFYSITGKGNMNDIKDNGVPGSNAYDIDKATAAKKKNPSWKIGTSGRDDVVKKKIKEGVPGPGTYEQEDKTKIKHPEYKFGTGKRTEDKPNDVPGPGSYRIPCSIVDVNDYTREQGEFDPEYRYV